MPIYWMPFLGTVTFLYFQYFAMFICSGIILILYSKMKIPKLQDIPNDRSMHTQPVKRAAGIFLALPFLAFLGMEIWTKDALHQETLFLTLGFLFCLLIGAFDDLFNLRAELKFFIEFSFFFILYLLFPFQMKILGFSTNNIYANALFYSVYTTSIINFCNFMDGIDLYLSSTLILSFAILAFLVGTNHFPEAGTSYLLCLIPFLFYNFPPARMFLGDSGSLPAGFMISLLPIKASTALGWSQTELTLIFVFIPVFLYDGIFTLIRRAFLRQNILSAHREHLYQLYAIYFPQKYWAVVLFTPMNILLSFLYILAFKSTGSILYGLGISFLVGLLLFLFGYSRVRSRNLIT